MRRQSESAAAAGALADAMTFASGVALAVSLALPSPAPTPPLVPLKTIANVRSTPFCSALRETVAPAIAALIGNDDLISASPRGFAAYSKDAYFWQSNASATLDVARIESLITPIVKNTKSVEALLSSHRFSATPQSDDDTALVRIRDRLRDVLTQQKRALNIISGFVDTEQLESIAQDDPPARLPFVPLLAPPKDQNAMPAIPGIELIPRGTPLPPTLDAIDEIRKTYGTLFSSTPVTPIIQDMAATQIATATTEALAAQSVLEAVPKCAPAPSPTP
ncbi:MAG: hypothetical protein ACXWMZ_08970 [Vulcanimicrobiaceae bacterium]